MLGRAHICAQRDEDQSDWSNERTTGCCDARGVHDAYAQSAAPASITMKVLLGDTTGNGIVNASDIIQTKGLTGSSITEANFRSDVTADGAINSSDVIAVKSRSGSAIP